MPRQKVKSRTPASTGRGLMDTWRRISIPITPESGESSKRWRRPGCQAPTTYASLTTTCAPRPKPPPRSASRWARSLTACCSRRTRSRCWRSPRGPTAPTPGCLRRWPARGTSAGPIRRSCVFTPVSRSVVWPRSVTRGRSARSSTPRCEFIRWCGPRVAIRRRCSPPISRSWSPLPAAPRRNWRQDLDPRAGDPTGPPDAGPVARSTVGGAAAVRGRDAVPAEHGGAASADVAGAHLASRLALRGGLRGRRHPRRHRLRLPWRGRSVVARAGAQGPGHSDAREGNAGVAGRLLRTHRTARATGRAGPWSGRTAAADAAVQPGTGRTGAAVHPGRPEPGVAAVHARRVRAAAAQLPLRGRPSGVRRARPRSAAVTPAGPPAAPQSVPSYPTVRKSPVWQVTLCVPLVTSAARKCEPSRPLQGGQLPAQGVQAHGTHPQGGVVERLEVEPVRGAAARVVPGSQPEPLAELVRRRLAGPAEVAVDLVVHVDRIGDRPGQHELQAQLRGPPLAGMKAGAGRHRQLQVHADVHDHPRGPEQRSFQHAEQVAVVGEVPELVHEPLGVQCPSLTVPGHP